MATRSGNSAAVIVGIAVMLGGAFGLGGVAPAAAQQPAEEKLGGLPKELFLSRAPADAKGVADALGAAKPGDNVVLHGRIAAGAAAFGEGRATLKLVDLKADAGAGAKAGVSVQVLDGKGKVIRTELRNKRGLRAGAEVVVVGKLAGDAKTPLVNAAGIYVVPPALPAGLFLPTEPKEAKPVEQVKAVAKVGDTVAIRGRIGGSKQPFVAERAVFTLVGPGLPSCAENPGDSCKTPWDYCCETKQEITAHSATIQVVDAAGQPIRTDLKGQGPAGGLKALGETIVIGKVVAADGKALVISATGIYAVPK